MVNNCNCVAERKAAPGISRALPFCFGMELIGPQRIRAIAPAELPLPGFLVPLPLGRS